VKPASGGATTVLKFNTKDLDSSPPNLSAGMSTQDKACLLAQAMQGGTNTTYIIAECKQNAGGDWVVEVKGATNTSWVVDRVQWMSHTKESTDCVGETDPTSTSWVANLTYAGQISGIQPSGAAATATAGTNVYTTTMSTGEFETVDSLVQALVDDLSAHGVHASKTGTGAMTISLGSSEDTVFCGTDDRTIDHIVTLAKN
jgi:hypothetical protein